MSDFDQTWPHADPDAVGNYTQDEPPDPGEYDVALVDAGAFTSKKDGRAWVKMRWQIVGSEHAWDVLQGFGSQSQANFTKKACLDLGVPIEQVDSLTMLDTAVREQIGRYYRVEVVKNGEYLNTYLRGGAAQGDIPAPNMAAAGAATAAGDGEDIPFLWRPVARADRYHGWSHFA